jgi:hypothetical protein
MDHQLIGPQGGRAQQVLQGGCQSHLRRQLPSGCPCPEGGGGVGREEVAEEGRGDEGAGLSVHKLLPLLLLLVLLLLLLVLLVSICLCSSRVW